MDKFFFPLMEGYYYGRRLNKKLRGILGKKLVQDSHATGLLCQAICNSGDGDYIEIGSLYGGSAITAALVKKEFNLEGIVYCVEPNPRNIFENAKLFGIENKIFLFRTASNEIPLKNKKFTCGFIDGDHRNPFPLNDWWLLQPIVTKYIIFDDYDKSEPGVEFAVADAMSWDSGWKAVHISNAMAIFERSI